MSKESEVTRRDFLRAARRAPALRPWVESTLSPTPAGFLGPMIGIPFGMIGCGDRAQEDLHAALKSPNVECVAAADLYTRRLDEVKKNRSHGQDLPGFPQIARRQID